MEILISNSSQTKLITNTSQPFLIVNLIGTNFLLTKTTSRDPFDKNINFQVQNKSFYSTFIRHVNLSYSSKLSELIQNLDILMNPGLQHFWLMFYQIHDFISFQPLKYKIQPPSYGIQVVVHKKNGNKLTTRISNLFRLHGQSFYFLPIQPSLTEQLSIITNKTMQVVYGITYFVKDVTICLPFVSICSEKPCPMNISYQIRPLLIGTCYIRAGVSYCTGFVKDEKYVISARHVLPFEDQKVGLEVGVRFYPYNQQKNGFISRIGQGGVDIIQITLTDNIISKRSTAILQQEQEKLVGKQIMALGFGKFGYSSKIFHKIDVVMPTIQFGVVSKIIKLGYLNVFVKTDASLYNGFSGCGIWQNQKLVGMAVFILKNKNNNSNFNKHNFSYTIGFIFKLLNQNSKQNLISQINAQIVRFDKIQTRYKVPFIPRI